MTLLPKVLMIVAVLGLAACNNPNRYGAGGAGADGTGGAGAGLGGDGVSTSGLGDPNNPASSVRVDWSTTKFTRSPTVWLK